MEPEPSERARIIARTYHQFTLGHMEWPHSDRPPRVQPSICWPCWNFTDYVEQALCAAGVIEVQVSADDGPA